jgi:hypothetical protein
MDQLPELALSVRQPKAYLAGCLKGDACITSGRPNVIHGYLQLRVSDWDFAEAFCDAIESGYGVRRRPREDERGYAYVRTYNGHGRFSHLKELYPSCPETQAAWLRGLFDSEGNVVCGKKRSQRPNSWDRRVAFFSTNMDTLEQALWYLERLGMSARIVPWCRSAGHRGTRPVFALVLYACRDNFEKFARIVGSSIDRKMTPLGLLPTTYHPDLKAARREAQLRGVSARKRNQLERGTY